MATHIKEQYPETEFCAFVSMRPSLSFLKNQSDINYTSLVLEEDIHKRIKTETIDYEYLSMIEKEYGTPNLWPHLYVDRVIMNGQLVREYPYDEPSLSHDDMLRRVQVTAKAIIEFLDREKPDVLVISVIGSVGSSLLYTIAKKRGIKTISIELTRIKSGMAFSETYKGFSWVSKRFNELEGGRISAKHDQAINFLKEFRNRPMAFRKEADPSFNNQALRRANLQFLHPKKLLWSVYWHSKTFIKDIGRIGGDYTDVLVWYATWDKIKRKSRGLIGYSDLYGTVDPNELFAYYPLHYDPEMSTLLYAPYYTDQVMLIKAIARSLPLGMKLYVKEHPAMVGFRTRAYYKQLLKIPNVKLIAPNISGHTLIQSAQLTLTITGSGGWESILLKKPVITFGDVYFNDVPGVKRCKGFEELPYLVQEQLHDWKHSEAQVVNFVSALLEDSVDFNYMDLWVYADTPKEIIDDTGLKQFADLLMEKAGMKKN